MRAFPVQAAGAAGMYVYNPDEWEAKGVSGSELADKDLKAVLEGLAKHLFGDVQVCSYLPPPQFGSFYSYFLSDVVKVTLATFPIKACRPFLACLS